VKELRSEIEKYKSGEPVVLQIERKGRLMYLSFEMDWTWLEMLQWICSVTT